MVDAKGHGNLLYLPLDKLMQAAAATQAQNGQAAAPADAVRTPRPAAAIPGDVPPQLDRGPDTTSSRDLRSRDRESR